MSENNAKLINFSNRTDIKAEAGEWLVKLHGGSLSTEEAAELIEWSSRSTFHREYLEKLTRNWDGMANLEALAGIFPLADLEAGLSIRKRSRAPGNIRARVTGWFGMQRKFAGLMVGFVAFAIGMFAILNFGLTGTNQAASTLYTTAVGEQARHELKDGSIVTLNTGTEILVDYSGDRRGVTLLKGEAGFDVAKDQSRPFIVFAGTGFAEALGTAFNVRLNGVGVDVLVTEGVVRVSTEPLLSGASEATRSDGLPATMSSNDQDFSQDVVLTAGETVRYDDTLQGDKQEVTHITLEQRLAWRKGTIIFDGETLGQALVEIARYTDKDIIIADESISEIRIGGYYKTGDIDAMLAALGAGIGVKVEYADKNRVVLSSM